MEAYPQLHERCVEIHFEETTLNRLDRESNLYLPVIGSLVYCMSSALDYENSEVAQILGTLCAMFTAGEIVTAFGWQGPFYLNGMLSLPYFISWMYLVYDSPTKHPRISEEEKNFLESSKEIDDRVIPMAPWIKIIINIPFWAHISVNMSVAWINFTIGTELPLYLTKVLNYNIQQTSVMSALPHIAQLASNVMCALTSQWIRNKGYLSKLVCYKVFNVIATFGPAIMMCTVPQLGCNHVSIIAVLSMAMFFNGAYYGGSFMNHLDLSENYAGSTAAFASTLSGIISFCAPLLANIITSENTLTAWNKVFYISAAVTAIPVIIFLFFGSVEEQSWNKISYKDDSEDDPEDGITKDIECKN
uniref:Inorganic phosphate cotransporter n=1 Tax=Timema poppense TaxID=170557 RepID=A0A7R9HBU5_TIMPO|nr:unnamed protein product [Timema poppensis]